MREPGFESVEALRRLVGARRVYYEVVPDLVFQGDRFEQVGHVLTLWASHERGARALPGCAACRDIFGELRLLAKWVVDGEGGPGALWEIEPFDAAVHSPSWDLDDDEIDLALRLVQRDGGGGAEAALGRQPAARARAVEGTRHPRGDLAPGERGCARASVSTARGVARRVTP